jgi:hypothetical protein
MKTLNILIVSDAIRVTLFLNEQFFLVIYKISPSDRHLSTR